MLRAELHRDAPSELQEELIHAAVVMASRPTVDHLVYISDLPLPERLQSAAARRKIIAVVSSAAEREALGRAGWRAVLVPDYALDRPDKFKLGLIGATARGYIRRGEKVVGLVGPEPAAYPDTLLVMDIEHTAAEATLFCEIGSGRISPSVFDAIVELAIELGIEGWEGHALGTMFVVGDVARVMKTSRQLTLNPFQGYPEPDRNLANPEVREALRNFATLEGAFVVREDGVVMAAGRYIQVDVRPEIAVPLGLGARHMAAALVTAATDAIAVVVSQATGTVRVFREGLTVLELTPSHRRT